MINEYFNHIALVNLKRREDRLQSSTSILNELGINYEVWEATDNTDFPCRGLVDSMQRYFRKVLAEGGTRCLVFEDDILPVFYEDNQTQTIKEVFDEIIQKCIEQLPEDWDLFYLGCNVASGIKKFYSANLIPIKFAYATHATAYSKRAMEFVCSKTINEPIDNCLVRDFQPHRNCYCSYPMIFSQVPGFSDIGRTYTDWSKFLEIRYNAEVKKLL